MRVPGIGTHGFVKLALDPWTTENDAFKVHHPLSRVPHEAFVP
jgi:hypothetical protein